MLLGFLVLFVVILILYVVQDNNLNKVRKQVEDLEMRLQARGISPVELPERASRTAEKEKPASPPAVMQPVAVTPAVNSANTAGSTKPADQRSANFPSIFEQFIAKTVKLLFGGNLVMKAGVLILFIGLGFFIRFISPLLSLEVRLASAALGGLLLLVFGWLVRRKKNEAALILQGAGLGVIYLTLFSSSRIFHLISPTLAMGFMLMMVIMAVSRALLPASGVLATLGMMGGFLAPVLVGEPGGGHVLLFTFYALLNAGIFAIAVFRQWRYLVFTGFVFTFGLGTLWGFHAFQPRIFWTTELFLILFFLMYFGMQLLTLWRWPAEQRVMDTVMFFGLPLLVFSLQSAITWQGEYFLPFSALGFGAIYIFTAAFCWRKRGQAMAHWINRLLVIGVIFANGAIPLAFEGQMGGIIWVIEGAALVGLGTRENKILFRVFGQLLQILAGIFILSDLGYWPQRMPVLNPVCLFGAVLSLAGLYSAYALEKNKARLSMFEKIFSMGLMLVWGIVWWYGTGIAEIGRVVENGFDQTHWLILVVLATSVGYAGLSRWLRWEGIAWATWLLPLVAGFSYPLLLMYEPHSAKIDMLRLGTWVGTVMGLWIMLALLEPMRGERWQKWLHLISFWLSMLVITGETAGLISIWLQGEGDWARLLTGVMPAVITLVLLRNQAASTIWPWRKFPTLYRTCGLALVGIYLWCWSVLICFAMPQPWPLYYAPFFNSMDLSQIFVLLVFWHWLWDTRRLTIPFLSRMPSRVGWYAFGLAAIGLATALVARGMHVYGKVDYAAAALFESLVFQMLLSIVWALIALGIMGIAAWKKHRESWLAGATLLGILVLKLFSVDLSGSETMARVISFVGVGILMLLIGYWFPLPAILKKENLS